MKIVACLVAGAGLLSLGAACAQGVVTGANGMTLYTFDKDRGGASACYDQCARNWPPFLGQAGARMGQGWTLVERTDGTMQWARQGRPVYYYAGDSKPGDATGDGKGGVWHVLNE